MACSGWAGLDPQAGLEWYEEIKFEPELMCETLDAKHSCAQCQLEDGDILIFQSSVPKVQLPTAFGHSYYLTNALLLSPGWPN